MAHALSKNAAVFQLRLAQMKAHAKLAHQVHVHEQDQRNTWTEKFQQTMHICHMFLYNGYQCCPAKFF